MDIAVYILKVIVIVAFNLTGIIGSVVPAIPGPPLCLAGLLVAYWGFTNSVSTAFLIISIVICLVCAILDYFAPVIITKFGGGSKWATVGSTIGMLVGLFFPPMGIVWIPFAGAFAGELIADFKIGKAFKVALLSFISFLLTIGIKLVCCGIITFVSIKACFV